ncbi:lysophospholipid acyltransferase family protein [Oceanibium sediminis]|uniref:lysophospholipid acyltransferase family protein n=1 Tax=Oceanibium sediminis TaxID=2026339 RepID=UPI000DD3036C|nr:lysophospholipid acyltransferase family protein [Oceanibium sediminis]
MVRLLRLGFFALIVRPLLMLVLGTNIRHRERLPAKGPAIIVANHNSHLDTLALMAMFPLKRLDDLRPVAAVDYFDKGGALAWFAKHIIGIIGVRRGQGGEGNPLAPAEAALDAGRILILFPEGTRGEPERLARFKKGVAHLAKARPDTPVTPVMLHGFGKALPKGTILFVPFNCDVFVGEAFRTDGTVDGFMTRMESAFETLTAEAGPAGWD